MRDEGEAAYGAGEARSRLHAPREGRRVDCGEGVGGAGGGDVGACEARHVLAPRREGRVEARRGEAPPCRAEALERRLVGALGVADDDDAAAAGGEGLHWGVGRGKLLRRGEDCGTDGWERGGRVVREGSASGSRYLCFTTAMLTRIAVIRVRGENGSFMDGCGKKKYTV